MTTVAPRRACIPVACLLLLTACGGREGRGGSGSGTPPPTPPAGVPQVRAGTPLYWDQGATALADAQGYSYTLYVNGQPRSLAPHECAGTDTSGVFTCHAPLPTTLPAGLATLAITASGTANGSTYESERSSTLDVWVLTDASASSARYATQRLHISGSTTDHEAAASPAILDLAPLPDGRLLSVDDVGRVGVVAHGRIAAFALEGMPHGATRVVSLAADEDFARTHAVFALEAATDRDDVWDVTRYREINGVLGERATIVPGLAPRVAQDGRLRIGSDGNIYAAIVDRLAGGSEPQRVTLFAFAADGSVPRGQPSRLLRAGVVGGVNFDWTPRGHVWLAPPDVAAAVFGAAATNTARLALIVAKIDGTTDCRTVSAKDPDHVFTTRAVSVDGARSVTALARTSDGSIVAAVSGRDGVPRVEALDTCARR